QSDAGLANPRLVLNVAVDGDQVKWTIQQGIQPDCHLEKDGAGNQQWIEVVAPPMDSIDHRARRPDGIGEMCRIGDDKLFAIDKISKEQQVDEEKCHTTDIDTELGERYGRYHGDDPR